MNSTTIISEESSLLIELAENRLNESSVKAMEEKKLEEYDKPENLYNRLGI